MTADQDGDEHRAVDLRRRRVPEPERVAALAQADVERHGRAAAERSRG